MKNQILSASALMLLGASQHTEAAKTSRPNFLIISCEDISPYLSMYGDSTAHTPNLDALAKQSLIFDNSFAAVGVSAPSRSGIITGMYPISLGTQNMRAANDVWGWGNRDYSHTAQDQTDQTGKPFGNYSVVTPSNVRCFSTYLRQAGYYCTNNPKTDYQFAPPISAWDENGNDANFTNRSQGQPFLAIFNINETHESQIWEMAKEPLRVDPAKVHLHSYMQQTDTARRDMARNYSNIEKMDALVGKYIDMLKKSGDYDNTIIMFYSDHGGPLPRGKRAIYDSGLRTPFMIHIPGSTKTGHTDRLMSYIDIAPTILSLAGVPIPAHMQGNAFAGKQEAAPRNYVFGSADRFDEKYDRVRSIRNKQYLLVKNYHTDQPRYMDVAYRRQMPMMREMLRLRDEGKLNKTQMIWFEPTKPAYEFFDVKADPEQVHDLVNDPKYKDIIARMQKELEHWQLSVADKGGIPESQWVESFWPNHQQPQTASPKVSTRGNIITAICSTKGSDIVYRVSDSEATIEELDHWKLYTGPIKKQAGKYLHIRTTRIGYKDSQATVIKM